MNAPLPSEEKLLEERQLTDAVVLQKMTRANPAVGDSLILQEAYKKQATELTNIEDRQHKLTLLLLGIFGAGSTLIGSGHVCISIGLKAALVAFSIAIFGLNWWYGNELHRVRGITRELLVRCEIALGFHEENRFLTGEKLYADTELGYGKKGRWLRNSYRWTVGIVCGAFILIVLLA
jgi:hypothetical protein